MGLSHVLFTAVNGSRHWGPLPFTLRPLGDGGGGVVGGGGGAELVVCEREKEYSSEGILSSSIWHAV